MLDERRITLREPFALTPPTRYGNTLETQEAPTLVGYNPGITRISPSSVGQITQSAERKGRELLIQN